MRLVSLNKIKLFKQIKANIQALVRGMKLCGCLTAEFFCQKQAMTLAGFYRFSVNRKLFVTSITSGKQNILLIFNDFDFAVGFENPSWV